jgi:hypothetical protein
MTIFCSLNKFVWIVGAARMTDAQQGAGEIRNKNDELYDLKGIKSS